MKVTKTNTAKIRAQSPMSWEPVPGLTALEVCKYWDTISLDDNVLLPQRLLFLLVQVHIS